MGIHVDVAGLNLTDKEQVYYVRLFQHLLRRGKRERFRGSITIHFDGSGLFGALKEESFHDVRNGSLVPTEESTPSNGATIPGVHFQPT